MNRWSGIQHDVNVFCGCILKIEARNQSDRSIDDKVYQHSLFYLFFVASMCNILLTVSFLTDCECMCIIQGR
jgi:hypothetical protein